ncbi:unnamed protein product, partial [Allacma fusca]
GTDELYCISQKPNQFNKVRNQLGGLYF